jgi:hypothetical protein
MVKKLIKKYITQSQQGERELREEIEFYRNLALYKTGTPTKEQIRERKDLAGDVNDN